MDTKNWLDLKAIPEDEAKIREIKATEGAQYVHDDLARWYGQCLDEAGLGMVKHAPCIEIHVAIDRVPRVP